MNLPHIRRTKEQVAGRFIDLCVVTCSRCNVPRNWPRFPPELASRWLTQRGYRDPLNAKTITCPQCVAAEKEAAVRIEPEEPKRKMTRKQAAYLALNKPKKEAEAMPDAVTIHIDPPKADTPRTATREDNRRISEHLDRVYLVDKQCYAEANTDQRVAEFLKVPRAWVAAVRDMTFGPEVNELRKSAPARLAVLENRLKEHEDRLLTYAAEVEADRKAVAALRAELGAA